MDFIDGWAREHPAPERADPELGYALDEEDADQDEDEATAPARAAWELWAWTPAGGTR